MKKWGSRSFWRKLDRRPGGDSESGQATVEFALTLVLLMAFILFVLQLSLVFAWGNYIQYATFLSARAYLAAGDTRADQAERARAVMERMVKKPGFAGLDRYPMLAKGEDGQDAMGGQVAGFSVDPPPQFDPTTRANSWMEGVRYTFRSRIFMMPLTGRERASSDGKEGSVRLTSESFLGRDPSHQECIEYMEQFGAIGKDVVIDNGC